MEQPQGPPPERADVDEAAAAAQAPTTAAAVHDDGTGGAEGAGGGGDAAAVENADGNPYDEDRPHDDGPAPAAAAVAPSPNVADPGVGQAAAEDPTGGPALQLGGHEAHLQDALQEPPEQRQTLPNVDLGGMGYVQRTSVCRVSHRKPLTPGVRTTGGIRSVRLNRAAARRRRRLAAPLVWMTKGGPWARWAWAVTLQNIPYSQRVLAQRLIPNALCRPGYDPSQLDPIGAHELEDYNQQQSSPSLASPLSASRTPFPPAVSSGCNG